LQKINSALRGFWSWLQDERVVITGTPALRLRPHLRVAEATPLSREVTPKDVLDFSFGCPEAELSGLLGYFFSLRPQEVFALKPSDFVAGSAALGTPASQTMARLGLYPRLVVQIERQRVQGGDTTPPKAHSKGWVACFDEQAARRIVAILKTKSADQELFTWGNDWLFELWSRHGIPDVSLKDLRRASCLWLGHHTRFREEPLSAMRHMRHRKLDTTQGYLRAPEVEVSRGLLDLDA
jgi:hypothetical protein